MVDLNINSGYKWFTDGDGLWVKGFMIDNYGRYRTGLELVSLLKERGAKELTIIARENSGCFCLVQESASNIFALVDKTRSFPLLWTLIDGDLKISDNLSPEFNYENRELLKHAALEFMFTNYVTGQHTLYKGVYSLQGAHYLTYDKKLKDLSVKPYYEYKHEHLEYNPRKLLAEIEPLHLKVFDKYFRAVGENRIVVPLSDGYDSRLIVYSLNKLGYKNVLCFTYGDTRSIIYEVPQNVARKNGFEWVFVEYTPEKWQATLNSEMYKSYVSFASRGISLPLPHDLLAFLELKNKGIIKPGDVIVPGHTGDFVESGHLPSTFLIGNKFEWEDILSAILHKHYDQWKLDEGYLVELFEDGLKKSDTYKTSYTREEAGNLFERWDWIERQCKYIVNSVRTYEFFDFKWMLPFWDNEILSFWSKVPIDWRIGRRLYLKYEYRKSKAIKYPVDESLRAVKMLCYKLHVYKIIMSAVKMARSKAHHLGSRNSGQIPKNELEKCRFIAKNTLAIKSKIFIQERFPKDFDNIYKKISEHKKS